MKKYIFSFLTSLLCIFSYSQNYFLAAPEGFAAGTTGGGSATPVTVSTFADLKSNLTSTGAKVILVSGTITVPINNQISAVITNKSLIGLPGAKLVNENQTFTGAGILNLKSGSNNIIIRNLIFVGPGAYDIDGKDNLTADGATNLWVDHCEFQDGLDGNFDIKGKSDNVTVSWCKFTYLKPPLAGGSGGSNDHRFSNLVGSSATDAPSDGHYSITFQNCFWSEGAKERMPRARNAELHILSSYYKTSVSGSKAIGLGGGVNNTTCYVENTNFAKIGSVYTNYPGDGGTVAINFVNSLKTPSNIGTVAAPTYSYTPIPVDKVEMFLTDATCGAGATLQVTASGIISPSNCTNLGINTTGANATKSIVSRVSDNSLYLYFPVKITGKVTIEIFSMAGQLLKTLQHNVKASVPVEINIASLKGGFYIFSAQAEKNALSGKFQKK
ncbi:pectate lyase [Kaistella flava (ex Peng et al. 2021)]|uniref:Pectate lyase n=1 Tax=Kaistella flava (ex Peng et al. 2021) TaxID=2038776 RepID=A0A7M2Y8K6_9FLAO|nr:pectate lyase [Kaistella flava (ex Peng et al. 2021)]QOW10430.1 pectate lyase [Kaistella flava (ex Peng et al. 2021)]